MQIHLLVSNNCVLLIKLIKLFESRQLKWSCFATCAVQYLADRDKGADIGVA